MPTGIGLFSGGLDSILAVCVLQQQGIRIIPVCFVTPFFGSQTAKKAVGQLGLTLKIVDITDAHLAMLKNPRYGFGRNMNPCIDCHALMFREAGAIMRQEQADFVFSGEVLGERRMSQNKNSLRTVARHSGFENYIVRPLSAQLLAETLPEKQGLIDRNRLLALQGRTRKPQLELARQFGLSFFPEPAGGCLLTDRGYAARLRDLFSHAGTPSRRDLELLSLGRHLRLSESTKVIIGRKKSENERLERLSRPEDAVLTLEHIPGPTVLVPGGTESIEELRLAASLCIRYSDIDNEEPATVRIVCRGESGEIRAQACADEFIRERLL